MSQSGSSYPPLKLLHLPNDPAYEQPEFRQHGPRDAFEKLHREGVLSAYEAYPFLAEWRRTRDAAATRAGILRLAGP